jgi:hypothetical protein
MPVTAKLSRKVCERMFVFWVGTLGTVIALLKL